MKQQYKILTIVILCFLLQLCLGTAIASSPADLSAAGADATSFGKSVNNGPSNAIKGTPVNSKDPGFNPTADMPQYTTTPPQTSYYNPSSTGSLSTDSIAITSGTGCTATDCSGGGTNSVNQSFMTKPTFVVDPKTDPLITNSTATISDPASVMGTIDSTYSGCTSVPQSCNTTYTESTCDEAIQTPDQTCHNTLSVAVTHPQNCTYGTIVASAQHYLNSNDYVAVRVKCDIAQQNKLEFEVYARGGMGACRGWQPIVMTPIPKLWLVPTTYSAIPGGFMSSASVFYVNQFIAVKGGGFIQADLTDVAKSAALLFPHWGGSCRPVYVTASGNCNSTTKMCNYNFNFFSIYSLFTSPTVSSYYTLPLTFKKPGNDTVVTETWNDTCGALSTLANCSTTGPVCTDGPSTKTINGETLTRACWNYDSKYTCPPAVSSNNCQPLRDAGCEQTKSSCLTAFSNGQCSVFTETYRCPDTKCTDSSVICGDQAYCVDGNCADQTYPPNGDMVDSATQLQALADIKNSFQTTLDPNKIFGGKPEGCKYITNATVAKITYDCCSDTGWFSSSCGASDKDVHYAVKAGTTVDLGTKCTWSVNLCLLGCSTCVEETRVYCVFNSKLARIIQVGARAQLGLTFGTAKAPDCGPLTLAQIQSLDFSKIDFSDFYADIKATTLDPAAVQSAISSSVSTKFGP